MGGRDQADVDAHRRAGANRIHLAVLHRPQQLYLHVARQVADLVKEQRSGMRLDELAGMLLGGTGEGALLVAEQDAFDERLRDGAAVHRDEWPRTAVAAVPDGTGDELLADPGLPLDQDRDVGARRLLGKPDGALHGIAAGHDVLEGERRAAALGGSARRAVDGFHLERVVDRRHQAVRRDRLDDEVEGARPHRPHHRLDAALRGLHDDRGGVVALAELLENGGAVHARHHQVEYDGRDVAAARAVDDLQRGLAAVDGDDLVSGAADSGFEQPALDRIVVDYEDATSH